MRKLNYSINLKQFKELKLELVPTIFTLHQYNLIFKKFNNLDMTNSEKSEFSRIISKKMKAIYKLHGKENDTVFIYGKEKMKIDRLKKAKALLNKFSRKFKNKHVLITGSFLYNGSYNDIDIFIISKYDKKDFRDGIYHINYLKPDVYGSLFFKSLSKLCVSNREINKNEIIEETKLNKLISIYQELFQDINKKTINIKPSLREFIIFSAYIQKRSIPDSFELDNITNSIMRYKDPTNIIKNTFVNAVCIGINQNQLKKAMEELIGLYNGLIQEYGQHKSYYQKIMQTFIEVLNIGC